MIRWNERYPRAPIAAVVLAVLLASACSTAKASPPTTLSPPISGERASTTTTLATTTPTTIALPPTTLPTTTSAALSGEAQVRSGMVEVRALYWKCYRDPWNCNPADFNEPGSPAFSASTASLDRRISERRYVGPEDVGYTTITEVEPIEDYQLITTCSYSTGFDYVKSPEGSDQPDQRLPHLNETIINTWRLVLDKTDQHWKLRQRDELSTKTEVNECPPKE